MSKSARPHELRVLGCADLRSGAGLEVRSVLTQPKRFALLSYIALASPGGHQRRDRLLAVFWPEFDNDRARAALRDGLYFLRRSLGDVMVTRGTEEVGIDPELLTVDAVAFQEALRDGRRADALELYGGELLAGFHLGSAPDFDSWLEDERARLHGLAVAAAVQLGDDASAQRLDDEASRWYRRALELAPHQESTLNRLLDLLVRSGDHPAAIAAYEAFASRLARELDISPSETTRARIAALRTAPAPAPRPAETTAALPVTPAEVAPVEAVHSVPGTRSPVSRPTQWRRALIVVALVLAVFTAPAAWRAVVGSAGTPRPEAADIVILPFTVHGGADAAFLGEGMVDLLGAKLNGAGGLRAVDPQALLTVLNSMPQRPADLGLGRDVAARFRAGHFIMGSIIQAGAALQVSAYLYDAEGELVSRADAVTPADSGLFTLVDDVARRLLAGQLADGNRPIAGLAAMTTSSLPALRRYLDGERSFRAGDFQGSIDALQEAVALDSTFALAYYRLSSAADWAGQATISEPAARSAMRHADRLPAPDRALVAARHEYWFGDAARAALLYRQLASTQPYELEGWFELGEVLFHAGPWFGQSLTKAEPAFRRVLSLNPRHVAAMVHLGRIGARQRRVALLDSLIEAVRGVEPGHSGIVELTALRTAITGDSAEIRQDGQRPGTAVAERVAVYTDNIVFAERLVRAQAALAGTRDERALAHQSLAHLLAAQGRWREAKLEIAGLAGLDRGLAAEVGANVLLALAAPAPRADVLAARNALLASALPDRADAPAADPAHFARARRSYQLGMLAIMLNEPAGEHVTSLETAPGSGDATAFSRNLGATLRARGLAAADSEAVALRLLEQQWLPPRKPLMIGWAWTHSNVNARLLRAQLLAGVGRHQDAMTWLDATVEDIAGSPLVLPQALLLRAQLNEALGRPGEAVDAYRALLALWARADAEFQPITAQVRRRLEALAR